MNNTICLYSLLKKMPEELIILIKEYLPISVLLFLNKKFYFKYHKNVKTIIPKNLYDNYLRHMVRNDAHFVFSLLAKENIKCWVYDKIIIYKNICYPNFYCFIKNYCIINKANNCRNALEKNFNESGLSKNQHKKNRILNIKWRI